MNVVTIVQPTHEPVTMEQVFRHLRLDDPESPDDHPDYGLLVSQLTAAREDCEKRTRRAFVKQKIRLLIDPRTRYWPWHRDWFDRCGAASVELKRPPVAEVTSVAYYDGSNALTSVDPADYFIVASEPARIQFSSGFFVGDCYTRSDALQVEYWAGYPWNDSPEDLTGEVPEAIKQAILLNVQLIYDDLTGDQRKSLEDARDWLLASYQVQLAL